MSFTAFLILCVIALGAVGLIKGWTSKRFTVEPNNRERLVVKEEYFGTSRVLGPGTHFPGPWFDELQRVDLNRREVKLTTIPTSANGVEMNVPLRFDIVVGRNFDPVSGRLQHPLTGSFDVSADDEDLVTDAAVRLAVFKIDFPRYEERVRQIVEGIAGLAFGQNTALECVSTATANVGNNVNQGVTIPPLLDKDGNLVPGFENPVTVHTSQEFREEMAQRINALADLELLTVGLNIVDVIVFQITAPSIQASLELPATAEREAQAARELRRLVGEDNLTVRAALVAENPQAFGQVVQAEAIRAAVEAGANAIRHAADAYANRQNQNPNNP